MSNISQESTDQLKMLISDIFQEFYYRHKKNGIYAFVVEIDEQFDIKSFLVSTETSIFDDSENKQQYLLEQDKWNMAKWKFKLRNQHELKFSSAPENMFQNSLISQIYDSAFQDQDLNEKLEWFIDAYQQAIHFLTQIYNLDLNRIVFLLKSTTNANFLAEHAARLNPASSLLFECIANTKIAAKSNPTQSHKLTQADKDLLIDLAQVVNNIEPYDSLLAAHNAYILTLDVSFQEANSHIQNLVRHIAALDGHEFALDRDEVLERINHFYKV